MPRRSVILASIMLISACTSSGDPEPQVTHLDERTAKQIEESTSYDDLSFQTAQTLDGVSYGLVGDGVTDNTAAFQNVLASGNRTIHIPAGDYVTSMLDIPSNTILILDPGVIIRDSGRLLTYDRLINIRGENVRIEGLGAKIVSKRSDYVTGEFRHGVFIYGAKRVLIFGLESTGHGGDGFYIGGPPGYPSTDILLKGCRADNNRRQGLSITSARRVRVTDCEFMNTNGTAPQFGVDLEPDDPVDFLDDIVFLRPYTRTNQGGGIMIYLTGLDATSHPVDVTIVEHTSVTEAPRLDTRVPAGVKATLRYSRR